MSLKIEAWKPLAEAAGAVAAAAIANRSMPSDEAPTFVANVTREFIKAVRAELLEQE